MRGIRPRRAAAGPAVAVAAAPLASRRLRGGLGGLRGGRRQVLEIHVEVADGAEPRADRAQVEPVAAEVMEDRRQVEQRLDVDQLVTDLRTAGKHARVIPKVDDIVTAVAADAREGDLVIVMSNGGFDDIHDKLLQALRA